MQVFASMGGTSFGDKSGFMVPRGAGIVKGEGLAPPAGFALYLLIGGYFAAPAASPFWSDPKGAKRSPGEGFGEHQVVLLVAHPRTPFTGELGTKTRRKCTGAGWPLTHRRSPARCHCAAKPEGRPCYPLRTRLPWSLPRGAAGVECCNPVGRGLPRRSPAAEAAGSVGRGGATE